MFTIYSKPGCGSCDKAKVLLASKNLPYVEKVLDVGQPKRQSVDYYTVEELKRLIPGARTVPQIFEGETLLGGYDALQKRLGE